MEHELEARFVGQDCQGLGIALQDLPPLELLQAAPKLRFQRLRCLQLHLTRNLQGMCQPSMSLLLCSLQLNWPSQLPRKPGTFLR